MLSLSLFLFPSVSISFSLLVVLGFPSTILFVPFVDVYGIVHADTSVGNRYREEFSDLGLGLGYRDMIEKLAEWGYDVGPTVCRNLLGTYRLGDTSSKDGCAALYTLSRKDLQRWFHVDGL